MNGIVVGVDGSEHAAAALRWAIEEGRRRRLPVTALLAWGYLAQHQAVLGPEFDADYDQHHAATALKTYVHEALDSSDWDRVRQHAVNDLPARGLCAASAGADLLVVGARGMGGFRALLLGSVSSQCLHLAACPVAVIHDERPPAAEGAMPRVVVGFDGSPGARRAVAWAVDEAVARRARLEIVMAWHTPVAVGYPSPGIAAFDPAPFEDHARIALASALDGVETTALAVPPQLVAVNGTPAISLLDHAKDADVLVVGSRGCGALKGLLVGSVAHQVAQHAAGAVVVVPPAPDHIAA